jgi:hypothetical protein
MSRAVIVVVLLIGLGAVSLGVVLWLFPRIEQVRFHDAAQQLHTAARLLREMESADQGRLQRSVGVLAQRPGLRELLRERPADPVARKTWLNNLRTEVAVLVAAASGTAPVKDLFLLDPKGNGLVRNIDLHWTGQTPSQHPAVAEAVHRASAGTGQSLLIAEQGSLCRVVVAPVMQEGRAHGLLLVSFPVDDELARMRASQLPPDVRYASLIEAGVSAKSLTPAGLSALEEHLRAHPDLSRKLLAGKRIDATTFGGDGSKYLMVGQAIEAPAGSDPCGLLVVQATAALDRPIRQLRLYLFAGTGFLFLLLLVLTVLFGGRLTRSLKRLEIEMMEVVHTGVARPIQGRGPAIVRSLAQLANQLVRLPPTAPVQDDATADERIPGEEQDLDGELDPDNETESEEEPQPGAGSVTAQLTEPAGQGDSGQPASLSDRADADVEEVYYRALFDRFQVSKRKVGQGDGKLNFQRFRRKLERQAQILEKKHGCKAVRFEVKIVSGKVTLLPRIFS